MFLKVLVIEHEVHIEALAILFTGVKLVTVSHSSLGSGHNNSNRTALLATVTILVIK